MNILNIKTKKRIDFIDITSQVNSFVKKSNVTQGVVMVYVPHTTCGIMINEGADPDVVRDIQFQLDNLVPFQNNFKHMEGNSDSHIKACLVGSSESIIIENSKLALGTWQSIFLCDFDGPRNRKVYLKILT